MSRRTRSSLFTAWAFVCLLLVKAAVPMLAAAAAQARGVPVAEVCPIYGVALPGAAHDEHAAHAHHHHGAPADPEGQPHTEAALSGDHCALSALAALAPPDVAAPAAIPAWTAMPAAPPPSCSALHDACAAWAARLKHGPPALA